MVRGTGKFKQKRGGGRSFSKDMVLDSEGVAAARRKPEDIDEDSDEDSEEDSDEEGSGSEESSEEEEGAATTELTRAERRDLKKQQVAAKQKAKEGGGEDGEEDPDLINPNHVQKKMTISDLNTPRELSRKEREQKEKQEAKDRYWKLHVQGKTEEAKSDLSRLAKIRAEREAAQAKRKAEADAKAAEIEAKKQAQLAASKRKT